MCISSSSIFSSSSSSFFPSSLSLASLRHAQCSLKAAAFGTCDLLEQSGSRSVWLNESTFSFATGLILLMSVIPSKYYHGGVAPFFDGVICDEVYWHSFLYFFIYSLLTFLLNRTSNQTKRVYLSTEAPFMPYHKVVGNYQQFKVTNFCKFTEVFP